MSRVNVVGNLQLGEVLNAPLQTDLLPPDLPEGTDKARVITVSRLICILSDHLDLKLSYATPEDIDNTTPHVIEYGLYIRREDPRFEKAQQVYGEVVFPEEQWPELARSPRDLSKHVYVKAKKADKKKPVGERAPNRATLHEIASRSAGHALESNLDRLEGFYHSLTDELSALERLSAELKGWQAAHYRTENLDVLRRVGHNAIHRAVETSAVNTSKSDLAVDGLHRAIQYRLYGPQSPANRRVKNWRQYVGMASEYAKARIDALITSMHATQASLEMYGPFLDAKNDGVPIDQANA